MTALTVYKSNDSILTLDGLSNGLSGAYINDATVAATIKDRSGNTVAGPLSMSYVTDSDGDYRATLPYDTDLDADTRYRAVIVANGGSGLVGTWSAPLFVVLRETT